MENSEEQIRKANKLLINANNLYMLLKFLRDIYPIGYSFDGLKKKMNLKIFLRTQLDELVKDGLIKKRNITGEFKNKLNPELIKLFPEYVISNKGMEFVNNIEVRNLTKNIKRLTKILVGFGIITIFLMSIQLILNYLV